MKDFVLLSDTVRVGGVTFYLLLFYYLLLRLTLQLRFFVFMSFRAVVLIAYSSNEVQIDI